MLYECLCCGGGYRTFFLHVSRCIVSWAHRLLRLLVVACSVCICIAVSDMFCREGEGNNVFGLLFDATRSWCYALIHSLRNLLHALDATLWNILHGTCYTFLMLRFETLQTNRHCHVVDTRFSENRPSKIHRCLQKLLTLFWMTTPAQNQLSLHLWIKGTDVYGNYA